MTNFTFLRDSPPPSTLTPPKPKASSTLPRAPAASEVDPSLLYESPHTDTHTAGLDGVFNNDEAKTIINIVHSFNASVDTKFPSSEAAVKAHLERLCKGLRQPAGQWPEC